LRDTAHPSSIHDPERSEHWDANAEDGEVGLESKKENGGGHRAGNVGAQVDSGDVDQSENGAYHATGLKLSIFVSREKAVSLYVRKTQREAGSNANLIRPSSPQLPNASDGQSHDD
jgi:hypothetical protein